MNAFTFIWNDVERYSNVVIHRRILYSLEGLKHNFTEQCYFLLSLYHLSLRCFQKNLFLQVTVGVVIFGMKMYQSISAVSLLDHKRYCSWFKILAFEWQNVQFCHKGSCIYDVHCKDQFCDPPPPHPHPQKWKMDCLKTVEFAYTRQITSPLPLFRMEVISAWPLILNFVH